MSESILLKKFMLEHSKIGSRLFRANSGRGWAGKSVGPFKNPGNISVEPGDILIKKARPFNGMQAGTSDLIGWTTIQITPDMVGKSAAIYTAAEVKAGSTRTTRQQTAYVRTVNEAGGIGVIARKLEDLLVAISNYKNGGNDSDKSKIHQH
jgi:hypothetical protein